MNEITTTIAVLFVMALAAGVTAIAYGNTGVSLLAGVACGFLGMALVFRRILR